MSSWAAIAAKPKPSVVEKKQTTPSAAEPLRAVDANASAGSTTISNGAAEPSTKESPKPVEAAALPTVDAAVVVQPPRGVWSKKSSTPEAAPPKPSDSVPVAVPDAPREAEPLKGNVEPIARHNEGSLKVDRKKAKRGAEPLKNVARAAADVKESMITADDLPSPASSHVTGSTSSSHNHAVNSSADALALSQPHAALEERPKVDSIAPPAQQSAAAEETSPLYPIGIPPPPITSWSAEPSPFEYDFTPFAKATEPVIPVLDSRVSLAEGLVPHFAQRKDGTKTFRAPLSVPTEAELIKREEALRSRETSIMQREKEVMRREAELQAARRQYEEELTKAQELQKQNQRDAEKLSERAHSLDVREQQQNRPQTSNASPHAMWYGAPSSQGEQTRSSNVIQAPPQRTLPTSQAYSQHHHHHHTLHHHHHTLHHHHHQHQHHLQHASDAFDEGYYGPDLSAYRGYPNYGPPQRIPPRQPPRLSAPNRPGTAHWSGADTTSSYQRYDMHPQLGAPGSSYGTGASSTWSTNP